MPHGMGRSWFRTTRNHAIDALVGERRERKNSKKGRNGRHKKSRHWRLVGALKLLSIS